jgi:hypothetical protein
MNQPGLKVLSVSSRRADVAMKFADDGELGVVRPTRQDLRADGVDQEWNLAATLAPSDKNPGLSEGLPPQPAR